MTVYNGERYLHAALDSILAQTFADFELIVIDDASTDGSSAILDNYDDRRIMRLTNDTNFGLTRSLNRGLDAARGRYIARMDADDISLPKRFEVQVAYLDTHSQTGLVSMEMQTIDEDGMPLPRPTTYEIMAGPYFHWSMLWRNLIVHPTVMMRRAVLETHYLRYDEAYRTAQDYDLWLQLAEYAGVAKLPDVGLLYRVHPGSVTHIAAEEQFRNRYLIQSAAWRRAARMPLTEAGAKVVYASALIYERSPQGVLSRPPYDAAEGVAVIEALMGRWLADDLGYAERRRVCVDAGNLLLGIAFVLWRTRSGSVWMPVRHALRIMPMAALPRQLLTWLLRVIQLGRIPHTGQ